MVKIDFKSSKLSKKAKKWNFSQNSNLLFSWASLHVSGCFIPQTKSPTYVIKWLKGYSEIFTYIREISNQSWDTNRETPCIYLGQSRGYPFFQGSLTWYCPNSRPPRPTRRLDGRTHILQRGGRKEDPIRRRGGCNATFCFASFRLSFVADRSLVRSLSWGHKSEEQRGAFWGFPPLGETFHVSFDSMLSFPKKHLCVR